ncbi:MAG: hypothetical protein P8181_08930, partial [bacterium]
ASENHGFVILWHNTGGVFGRADDSGYVFPRGVTPNLPQDAISQGGEVLSLAAARVNADIFPEVYY